MRRYLTIGLLFGVMAAPARAQEAHPLDLGYATQDLKFTVIDLVGKTQDLKFTLIDLAGKTQDLQVKETATEIRIALAADVLFDFDKSTIRPAAADALKKVASMIRDHPGVTVLIEGHTDGKGSDAYNQPLSEQRATSMRDWLLAKEGLKGVKFATKGFGSKQPVAPNAKPDGSDDPDGRQKNRRVEIVIAKE